MCHRGELWSQSGFVTSKFEATDLAHWVDQKYRKDENALQRFLHISIHPD
jgi:hypothetical protein